MQFYLILTDSLLFISVLISLLMPENMDAMVEASRVFGNFSRSSEVRTVLAEHKGKLRKTGTLRCSLLFFTVHLCYPFDKVNFTSKLYSSVFCH